MSGSFESAMTLARMIMAEGDMPLLDRLQDAHEHELEHVRKSEYHRGYEDGRRSMDAEHYAVALRLRALPLDGDTQENLGQIARAVWHSDFGWTQGACKALRDELVRLLGGVSERPHTTSIYDVLDNERHEVVCELRNTSLETGSAIKKLAHALGVKWNPDNAPKSMGLLRDRLIHLLGEDECNFSGVESYMDATGEKGNPAETSDASTEHVSFDTPSPEDGTCPNPVQSASIIDELGNERHKAVCELRKLRECDAKIWNIEISIALGLDLHASNDDICDRLIYLLGGDEPTESLGSFLSRKSVEAMSRRADQSHESSPMRLENETGITAEFRECVETASKSHDHCISEAELLEIADRIDEEAEHNEQKIEVLMVERQSIRDELKKMQSERDSIKRAAERDADHLECITNALNDAERERDELQEKLDEAEFAIANWREREKSFDASERLREELRQERDYWKSVAKNNVEHLNVINAETISDLKKVTGERDELRERLDRVAAALRGVERGTMSAWEAEESVRGSSN